MKSFFIILFIASYISISVFGLFGMHTLADMNMIGHEMPESKCIGAIAKGVDCPRQDNQISFTTFHIDAFKGFSSAIFGENIMIMLLSVLLSLIFLGLLSLVRHLFKLPQPVFNKYRFGSNFYSSRNRKLIRWLALHENSPAIF